MNKKNKAIVVRDDENGLVAPDRLINAPDGSRDFVLTDELAKAMGPALVAEAKQKRADSIAHSMVACTEDLFRQIEVMEQRKHECERRIAELHMRIEDMRQGRYALDRENRIIFPHLPPPHLP